MTPLRYPSLYQINTRVWLRELAGQGPPLTLDQISDGHLDRWAQAGFDWIWPLGVWQTGPAGREVSRNLWRAESAGSQSDLTEEDITGSPFAIQAYQVHRDFGGDDALARFRERLRTRNLRLLLDFVPNHTAPDHPWVLEHPEYYILGNEEDLAREPGNYLRVATRHGPLILAHGRDPYFPGWTDTLQLNYRSQGLRQAMIGELLRVAARCDGVRCDMAMLLLPEVIHRTWGNKSLPADGSPPIDKPFWPDAIGRVRARPSSVGEVNRENFLFMAEVYWDLEWILQQQGFDYTYDKRLYDRLHARQTEAIRGHLGADGEFQRKSVRFLENHDEPRAAAAFPLEIHHAAAVIAFMVPGLRFFHEGQFEGRRLRVSMHLARRPAEPVDPAIKKFYARLLDILKLPAVRNGAWKLLECRPAWDGNFTAGQFIAFSWESKDQRLLVTVNYGPTQGQCRVKPPWQDLSGRAFLLRDRMSDAAYERAGSDLSTEGLYIDLPPWHYYVFEMLPQ